MAFWFGSRMLERVPSKVTVDPAKQALAKDIAAARLLVRQAEEAKAKEEADLAAAEAEAISLVRGHPEAPDPSSPITRMAPTYPENEDRGTFLGDTSQAGIDLIKHFEGFRSKPYKCPAGVWTIGYGTTNAINSGTLPITEAEAENMLKSDLDRFERSVLKLVTVPVSQNEFDALVSFTYNLGEGNLKKSTLLRRLNSDDKASAAEEFLKWNKAGGKVLNGLVKRREAERKMFLGE
jgi:lysozyme